MPSSESPTVDAGARHARTGLNDDLEHRGHLSNAPKLEQRKMRIRHPDNCTAVRAMAGIEQLDLLQPRFEQLGAQAVGERSG